MKRIRYWESRDGEATTEWRLIIKERVKDKLKMDLWKRLNTRPLRFIIFLFQRYFFFLSLNASGFYSWYFLWQPSSLIFFYKKFYTSRTTISLHKTFLMLRGLSYVSVAESPWHMQKTMRIVRSSDLLCLMRRMPIVRSLQIRPASRITFNAHLTSTRPS